MRFLKSIVLAATAVGVIASQAAAQTPTNVTVKISSSPNDHVVDAGNGGGWIASITPVSGVKFADMIVYCFDDQRQFNYNTNMTYTLLTFNDFVNNAGVVGGGGMRDAQWNTIDLQDLNSMAALASTYTHKPGVQSGNAAIQAQIWAIANGGTGSYAGDLSKDWMVLVDAAEWKHGLDEKKPAGHQSFLVQVVPPRIVPEPSSIALMVAGMAGLIAVGRRRVNS